MKWLLMISGFLIVGGAVLAAYAQTLPVYTDEGAPGRLSLKLADLPREKRFAAWYSELKQFETRHKSLSDFGRGLAAAGVGLALATAFLAAYKRYNWMRKVYTILLIWMGLWAVRVPLSFWYYGLRQRRFDYPTWGDSIAIGIISEAVAWIIAGALSALLLALFLIRHPLPDDLALQLPRSVWGWIRAGLLGLWLVLNAVCAYEGVVDGNEGMALTCLVSGAILLLLLSAGEIEPAASPNGGPVGPVASFEASEGPPSVS